MRKTVDLDHSRVSRGAQIVFLKADIGKLDHRDSAGGSLVWSLLFGVASSEPRAGSSSSMRPAGQSEAIVDEVDQVTRSAMLTASSALGSP
jgi:hypothetical protein